MTDIAQPDRMPSYFIPHGGGPCFFMDSNPPGLWDGLATFLRGIAATLPARPRAIVLISAHWQTEGFCVGSGARPQMVYDYYGFPPHTYQLQYPAAGDPDLAGQVGALLTAAKLPTRSDPTHGFDHGVFVPLLLVYPHADIPVVTLSLDANAVAETLLAAGRALAPLRDQGVLIIGSGMSFHNMRGFGNPKYLPAGVAFDDWLTRAVATPDPAARDTQLASWETAPHAHDCHPPGGEEHLLPLLVAAGAGGNDPGVSVYGETIGGFRISGFRFG